MHMSSDRPLLGGVRRITAMDLLILAITLVGLVLLLVALYKAAPLVDFGTRKDNAVKREGRRSMPLAVAVVLASAILLAFSGKRGAGVLVALPALIPGGMLVVLDEDYAVLGALAYLATAPIALGAVLTSILRRSP